MAHAVLRSLLSSPGHTAIGNKTIAYEPSQSSRLTDIRSHVAFGDALIQDRHRHARQTIVAKAGARQFADREGDVPSDDESMQSGKGFASVEAELKGMQFVRWFREAWPYIQGHRGSTFVIVIPGEVVSHQDSFNYILQVRHCNIVNECCQQFDQAGTREPGRSLHSQAWLSPVPHIFQDVALMHGLGVKLVLVPGSQVQIDELLRERGVEPVSVGAYRVTDASALEAAMQVRENVA